MKSMKRCKWVGSDPLMIEYHDSEWGVPAYDDRLLFEMLSLGGAQAGLNWSTILKKRDRYREVFAAFDPCKVARYSEKKFEKLLEDPGIIRNRLKIQSTINNAKAVRRIQREFGTFTDFIWSFVNKRPIQNRWRSMSEIPTESKESREMSKELKKRGFTFVGPTICYAFMQAAGMVNDHEVGCFRHKQLEK
jgi:DNA-3-methyladenine glycosylase I